MSKLITRLKILLLERLSAKKEIGTKRPPGINLGAFSNSVQRGESPINRRGGYTLTGLLDQVQSVNRQHVRRQKRCHRNVLEMQGLGEHAN